MSNKYSGLVFVEDVLRDEIDTSLKTIQQDTPLMQRLFQRKSASDQDAMLNFFTQNEIPVRLGFAREPYEVPQVSVTLAGDAEERFLGDELFVRDRDLGLTADINAAITDKQLVPFNLPFINLAGGTVPVTGKIQINGEKFTYDQGTGTDLNILGRRAVNTLKEAHAVGDQITWLQLERELGVHYKSTYRIDVVGDNADLVLWIQTLIKVVLLLSQNKLTEEGLSEFSLAGTDYAPRPALYPQFVYVRTLLLTARVEAPFPEALAEILNIVLVETIDGTVFANPIIAPKQ